VCRGSYYRSRSGDLPRGLGLLLDPTGPDKRKSDGWPCVQGERRIGGDMQWAVESSLPEAGTEMQVGMGEKVGDTTVDREIMSGEQTCRVTG
jgi:hypothetical protein